MVQPLPGDKSYNSELFFGGFHGLTEDGLPKVIQDHYEYAVSNAAAFSYHTMWRAAGSGVVGGALIGLVALAVGGGGVGMFVSFATEEGVLNGIATGIGEALGNGLLALGAAAIGSASGAVYTVSQHRDTVNKELMKTREMMRELQGVVRDQQLGKAQAAEQEPSQDDPHVVHDFDPTMASNKEGVEQWQANAQARRERELKALESLSGQPKKDVESWIAREEARKHELQNEERGRT